VSDKRSFLGTMEDESRNPQGEMHSPTRPGGCRFRKSKQNPGVILKRGNPQNEIARFPMQHPGKKGKGKPLLSKPATITVA